MDRIDKMVQDIFADRLDPATLSTNDLELVTDAIYEMAENLLDGPHREAAEAILEVLADVVDDRMADTDMSEFADAVEQAEARGSTYFEFDSYTLH